MKTWLGRPATNSSGSDNLLTEVCALFSWKYSLFWAGKATDSRTLQSTPKREVESRPIKTRDRAEFSGAEIALTLRNW